MRKLSLALTLIFISFALIFSGCANQTAEKAPAQEQAPKQAELAKKVFKVGVSQIVAHPALDLDQKGFLDQMKEEGFIQGQNVQIDVKLAQGDPNMAKTIADKFVADKVDAILAITTPSAQSAAMATKQTDIPVVFIAVSDAKAAGLVTDITKATGTNITGVNTADPIEEQMDLMLKIQPSIKKLGVVYNSGEANSVSNVNRIKEKLKGTAEVVEVTVASSNEVQAAAQSLVGRVDAAYMPTDNTVMSAVDTLIKTCQDNKLPLYSGDTESVKKGALATMSNDEYDCGRQGATLVARILKGEKAGEISIEPIRKRLTIVNNVAAAKYGITLPKEVIDKADEVIK